MAILAMGLLVIQLGYFGQQWQLVHVDNEMSWVVSLEQNMILLEGPFSFGLSIKRCAQSGAAG
eukprot:8784025-Karenia_brevis.AAC.1